MDRNEFLFLLGGLKWTLALSAIGFVVRRCRRPWRRAGADVWLPHARALHGRLHRPVPGHAAADAAVRRLLRIALVGLKLDAWVAVAIGFTLHASAYLGEIWRGSIEAVPKGQIEAAKALSLNYISRMKDVILPQALRISLPATIGFLVQLIKGTSLAAIVGFTELARAGTIVSNQIFKPLLVFGIVGALYFAICWPLSLYGARLERQFAKAAR